jgi:plastocyanin
MSQRARLGVIAAAVVVVVAGFVIASSSDDSKDSKTSSTPSTQLKERPANGPPGVTAPTKIRIKGGKPVGGVQDISVRKGDTIRFVVESDVADEVHVHGYDLMKDVEAGGKVSFSFKAKSDGAYEVELENHGEQIAELRVEP